MVRVKATDNLADYLTVGEAASVLGVSSATLRNWDRAGKLKPYRHPFNRYRLYRRDELEALLEKLRTVKEGKI
jgi:excisionase family DNA binding protein